MDWSTFPLALQIHPSLPFITPTNTLPGLCNPYAKNPFLRDVLGYKRPWVYYAAMFLDPILRFNWIFYAIYSQDLQHSAALSFFVSLSEVCRRAIWTLFRVENEHCTNVGRFRASRDVPLPYDIPPSQPHSPVTEQERPSSDEALHGVSHQQFSHRRASGADLETAAAYVEATPGSGSLRRRNTPSTMGQPATPMQRGMARVGTMMAQAHAQDFERKRRPNAGDEADAGDAALGPGAAESSDEEDEEEEVDPEG
ncbi:MAG: hypothetical protein LQ347_001771, partial [Umbilicaria vellea]